MANEITNFSQELIKSALDAIRELEAKEAKELEATEANYAKSLDDGLSSMLKQATSEETAFAEREEAKSPNKLKDLNKEIADLEQELSANEQSDTEKSKRRRNKNVDTLRASSLANVRMRRLVIKRTIVEEGKVALLSELIPDKLLKSIIPFKTASVVNSIAQYKDAINRRIANCISPLLPEKIRVARAICGSRPFKEHPGFLWKTPKEYGDYSMWVNPDIPFFFDQFTEMQIMREKCDTRKIASIDKAVQSYMQSVAILGKREASLAIKLLRINTFEELLNFDVEAFEYVYAQYKKQQEEEAALLRGENQETLAKAAEANLVDMKQVEAQMEEYYASMAKSAEGFATDKK